MRKKKRNPKNVLAHTRKLFAFMDEHPEKPQVKRINAIVELLAAIRNEKRFDEKAELIDRMQQAFRRYRWTREIFSGYPGNDQTNIGPHVWLSADVFGSLAKPNIEPKEDDASEWDAGNILLLIAEYYPDYLSKIDRCDVCRQMDARPEIGSPLLRREVPTIRI